MRLFLSIAAASALLSGHAAAQGFKPTRPVDLIVHTGPGGGSDVFARIVNNIFEQEKLLPVRANVANRSGGGGAAAMAYVAEKKGDPHTIAFYTPVWLTVPLTSKEAHVQFLDLTPIANLIYDPSLIIVRREAPYQSLNDFVEAAKKSPGQLRQAGSSIQAVGNLVRQLLQKQTGASWSYIPMPGGGERIAALLGGHVNIMVIEPAEAGEHIRAGNMRVLAQVTDKRLPAFPNVPTLKEAGFDVPSVPQVRGVVAPPAIPKENVAYWEGVFHKLTQTESWKKFLADNQFEDGYQSAAELVKFYDEFTDRMRGILKEAGAKVVR